MRMRRCGPHHRSASTSSGSRPSPYVQRAKVFGKPGCRAMKSEMDEGVRGWVYNNIRENYWRVAHYYEFEDLIQDSFIVWRKIVDRYPEVTDAKHRMGLFKTAFRNHIHDLSKKRTAYVQSCLLEAELDSPLASLRDSDDGSQDPNVRLLVAQLPAKLQLLLTRLYDERRGHPNRLRLDGTRETINERLCRLAGLDPATRNVREALQTYLHGGRLHPQYD